MSATRPSVRNGSSRNLHLLDQCRPIRTRCLGQNPAAVLRRRAHAGTKGAKDRRCGSDRWSSNNPSHHLGDTTTAGHNDKPQAWSVSPFPTIQRRLSDGRRMLARRDSSVNILGRFCGDRSPAVLGTCRLGWAQRLIKAAFMSVAAIRRDDAKTTPWGILNDVFWRFRRCVSWDMHDGGCMSGPSPAWLTRRGAGRRIDSLLWRTVWL